ncbi:MAG: phosphopantetheine-binding protein [Bacteroidales bacterium]|nr:phosphopantetheine-binding protein [Bacteroidales bacterium]
MYAEHFDFGCEANDVTEEMDSEKDLDWDSLDQVEFIMEVEREFNICIPDDDLFSIGSSHEQEICSACGET